MSFLYPRILSVARPITDRALGENDYGGLNANYENRFVPVFQGIPASIQMKASRGKPDAGLPADAQKTFWTIYIPLSAGIAAGAIFTRDVITDDLGNKFQVTANYYDSLGWSMTAEKLEV